MKRWLKQNLTVRVPPLCAIQADRMVTASIWFAIMLSSVKIIAGI